MELSVNTTEYIQTSLLSTQIDKYESFAGAGKQSFSPNRQREREREREKGRGSHNVPQ